MLQRSAEDADSLLVALEGTTLDWTASSLLMLAGAVALGFLPVLTLRNGNARVVFAALAIAAGYGVVEAVRQAGSPSAGMGSFTWGIIAVGAGLVVAVLFGIGLAGALSRLVSRLTHREPAWWVTAALGALVLALMFGPSVLSSVRAAVAARAAASDVVERARDGARPQTQRQLADRVAAAISQTVGIADAGPAADGLAVAWHPGPLQADLRDRGALSQYLRTLLAGQYAAQGGGPGGVREGDSVLVEWGDAVALADIDPVCAKLLTLPDGGKLFPGAKYRLLNVVLQREATRVPFVTLVAVDDHGKWWLVGMQPPQ